MSTPRERGIEIPSTMTPHQMAMRIVQLEDDVALAEEAVKAADNLVKTALAKVEDYSELLQQRNELRALLAEANEMLGVHACNLRIDGYDEDAVEVEALHDSIVAALGGA